MPSNQELVDYLNEYGVCQICQLRYLKARGNEYEDIQQSFEKLNVKLETVAEDPGVDNTSAKKKRCNDCPCCLGLFSSEFQSTLIEGILNSNLKDYESEQIVVAITMPMCLQIRQLSMWFALLKKFDNQGIDKKRAPDVPLKEAVKLIINPIICEKIGKSYDVNNGLMINITLEHKQESEELAQMTKFHSAAFPPPANGKKRPEVSRGMLDKQLMPASIDGKLFEEYLPVPPAIPEEPLILKEITLTGPTVYVAGRYRKLSRELSHTAWILNGKRVMPDSIEEILTRSIAPYFCENYAKVIFMSSGREDVDVRCLGKGRPFVLEIPNSRRTSLAGKDAHKMEIAIDESNKVSVHNLQLVQREELVHIKMGEEQKRKYYRALCVLETPATLDILQKMNVTEGFEIQQKTPIRVLHRRALHTRPRMIYSLKARVQRDQPKLVVLDIESQAGTYIKELVHGEFGRTTPSVSSIIGQNIDIIALDVVGIHLDWPKDIDNSLAEANNDLIAN